MKKITDREILALAGEEASRTADRYESFGEFRRRFIDYLRSRGRIIEDRRAGVRPVHELFPRSKRDLQNG